jgi:hypothetical protein
MTAHQTHQIKNERTISVLKSANRILYLFRGAVVVTVIAEDDLAE